MKNFTKSVAAVLGLAVLSTTPVQSYAASFHAMPELAKGESIVEEVHRRRFRHRHRRKRSNGGAVAAGVIGGLIIGGIIANSSRRSADRDEAHIDWCFDRYRSYRVHDNSWKPYNGPRRQCNSPYY
ncbi:MAG: BA14K family protein [Rhizobiaceae bacterium]